MELGRITGIREIGQVSLRREREVRPPFALEGSGRMEDDAYGESGGQADRGLEDEEEVSDEAGESPEGTSTPDNTLDFFA